MRWPSAAGGRRSACRKLILTAAPPPAPGRAHPHAEHPGSPDWCPRPGSTPQGSPASPVRLESSAPRRTVGTAALLFTRRVHPAGSRWERDSPRFPSQRDTSATCPQLSSLSLTTHSGQSPRCRARCRPAPGRPAAAAIFAEDPCMRRRSSEETTKVVGRLLPGSPTNATTMLCGRMGPGALTG